MDAIEYWRFCDELTVVQAALLLVDQDPGPVAQYVNAWKSDEKPDGYAAVLSALQHSVVGDRLPATKVSLGLDYKHPDSQNALTSMNWHATRVRLSDLMAWLEERGVRTGFFFPKRPVTVDYLDKTNDCFAPKLAAAVEAWNAVRSERISKMSPRTVKQDLTRWLNLHAGEYGLINDEGEPNRQAVEEVAKVANWNLKGGAPKTPGEPVLEQDDESPPPF